MAAGYAHIPMENRRPVPPAGPATFADIHCHCLAGLDDGPTSLAESLELCRALLADGVHTVIATPHQLGRYDLTNPAPRVREAVEELREALADADLPLVVLPGADVRIDERIVRLIQSDQVLTLADRGADLLLELPHDGFLDPMRLIHMLSDMQVRVIVSHPERNRHLAERPHLVQPWLAEGAALQVTAASLLGDFGARAESAAWFWMSRGEVALVAGDSHDLRKRPPSMRRAFRRITTRLGLNIAQRVCVDNPRRIIEGGQTDAARQTHETVGNIPA